MRYFIDLILGPILLGILACFLWMVLSVRGCGAELPALLPVVAPEPGSLPRTPTLKGVVIASRYDGIQDDMRLWVLLEDGRVLKTWLSSCKVELACSDCKCCKSCCCKKEKKDGP